MIFFSPPPGWTERANLKKCLPEDDWCMDVLLVIMVQQVTLKAFMSDCVFVWAMITEQVTGTNLGEFSETQVTAQWFQNGVQSDTGVPWYKSRCGMGFNDIRYTKSEFVSALCALMSPSVGCDESLSHKLCEWRRTTIAFFCRQNHN